MAVRTHWNARRDTIDGRGTGGFDPAVVLNVHGVAAGRAALVFPYADSNGILSSFGLVSMAVHDVDLPPFGPLVKPNVLSISVSPAPAGDIFTASRLSSVATRS